jgi:hypothetical protein
MGNIKQLIQFDKLKNECEEKGLKPLAPSLICLLDQGAPPEIKDATGLKYDAGKTPNVLFNTGGSLTLMIGDPAIVQEMLVTKNA